jgi:uncharacterized membrane protein YjjP (DUF1212 family)
MAHNGDVNESPEHESPATPDYLVAPEMDLAGEDSLEPVSLIRQSGAIMRMGRMMLAAGTASYRVKEGMQAVATSLGVTGHSEHVTLTEITATTHRGAIFRTEVSEIRLISVDADRISRLDQLRRDLPVRATPEDIHARLDAIEAHGPYYPGWANATFAGGACAGFAVLNNARVWEVLIVFLAAVAGQALRRFLHRRHLNHFGTTMLAAAVASGAYISGLGLLNAWGISIENHAAGYISTVLFLLPGFALITGALDIAKLDLSAGVSRIAFGTTMTLAAGASVWAVSLAESLDTHQRNPVALEWPLQWGLWAVASAIGVFGFAMMFNSPWRLAATAAAIGLVANTGRLIAMDHGMRIQAATALACLVIGVLAALVSSRGRWPVITLSVPAVLLMIPGVTAHQAVVSVNESRYADAMSGILQAVLTVLAVMVGLVIAKLLTDRDWAFER